MEAIMKVQSTLGVILLSIASGAAVAGAPIQIPEPGIMELLALAAVAAVVVAIRKGPK